MNDIPEKLFATTDPNNRVVFSFEDKYFADEYLVMIKHHNDINYLTYYSAGEREAELITKENSMVSLLLDPQFLQEQECTAPEMNEEYRFSVQLRKYSTESYQW